ncbi:type VI secretion system tube protein TssD [Aquimarina muelleri]|uniref:type VI secretion system tube protein TssD n=1 Tax=Aquimarina muelleri TaxID=279356 RepID=UPI003F689611
MIKAQLFVLGTIRELLWTDLEYNRYLNHKTGRCGEIPMGGLITLSFISGYDDDRLLRWITHSQKDEFCTLTEGKIVFYQGDFDGIILFEYKFNDAALIYWKEKFTAIGEEPMTVTMTISAAIQEVKGVTLVKPWKESWVPTSEQMPYQQINNDDEPRLIEYHFENKKGEIIEEKNIRPNQEIELVITTEKADNTTMRVDLNNSRLDFIHNGKIIENDILKGVKIYDEETRVLLTTIKQ